MLPLVLSLRLLCMVASYCCRWVGSRVVLRLWVCRCVGVCKHPSICARRHTHTHARRHPDMYINPHPFTMITHGRLGLTNFLTNRKAKGEAPTATRQGATPSTPMSPKIRATVSATEASTKGTESRRRPPRGTKKRRRPPRETQKGHQGQRETIIKWQTKENN